MSQLTVAISGSGPGGFIQTITGNSGGPVGPTGGNINVVGSGNINVAGNAGTSTETITLIGMTNHAIPVGNAAGGLTSLSVAGNGQIPIGSAGANPVIANITGSGGITVTNGAGTIDISGASLAFTWNEVLGITQAIAVNNGYVANNVALVTLTLPAVSAFGSIIRVSGKGTGLWRIAQNAGQAIHFGVSDTTPGVGGSLTAIARYDCVELLCTTANTDFTVLSVQGNLTVV